MRREGQEFDHEYDASTDATTFFRWKERIENAQSAASMVAIIDELPVDNPQIASFLLGDADHAGFLEQIRSAPPEPFSKQERQGRHDFDLDVFFDEEGVPEAIAQSIAWKLADSARDKRQFTDEFRRTYCAFLARQFFVWRNRLVGETAILTDESASEWTEGDIDVTSDDDWNRMEREERSWDEEDRDFLSYERLLTSNSAIFDEQSLPLLLRIFDEMPTAALHEPVARALSHADPHGAAHELLQRVRSANTDPLTKRVASRLLYLIELGNIGISETGVRYLDKTYDLGEFNDPNYFVQRLTGEGEVGIFDDNKTLQKYFNLGDLSSAEKQIKATVLDLTLNTVFTSKEDETPEERGEREALLQEFKEKYLNVYNDEFFKETGIRFNDLSLREQFWFIQFILHGDAEKQKRALELVKQHKEAGLRTFISMEFDARGGEYALSIAEKNDARDTAAIFNKFAEIISAVQRLESYLKDKFPKNALSEESLAAMAKDISMRGCILLKTFAEKGMPTSRSKDDRRRLLSELASVRADVMLFAHAFRIAKEQGNINWQEIRGVRLFHKDSAELTAEERERMSAIFIANRRSNTAAYPEAWLEERKKEFEDLIASGGKKFFLLSDEDTVVAFMHTEPRGDKLYAGSLNVDTEGRGKKIGSAFFQAVLDQEGKSQAIEAIVNAKNPMLKHYIQDFGFAILETRENYNGSGQRYYVIERQPGGAKRDEASPLPAAA